VEAEDQDQEQLPGLGIRVGIRAGGPREPLALRPSMMPVPAVEEISAQPSAEQAALSLELELALTAPLAATGLWNLITTWWGVVGPVVPQGAEGLELVNTVRLPGQRVRPIPEAADRVRPPAQIIFPVPVEHQELPVT
jgi:hypothetical protein